MNGTDKKTFRIALDAMGSDFAPLNEIQGAIKVLENKEYRQNLEIVLIGKESQIRSALSQYNASGLNISIVNADEVITMEDDPTVAFKTKKESSIFKGLELLKLGQVDAFASAGNTGAVLSGATLSLGRINGVSRPTIGTFLPTQKNTPTFLLDVGANTICKPRHLFEFAVMGSILATQSLGIENPKVGLLNIGEEPSKGTETVQQTFEMLKDSDLNFIGNVEGRDILAGTADIVVCDGFVGNIVLKFAESINGILKFKMKEYASKNFLNMLSISFLKPTLRNVLKGFDYQEYGGVPLLGVNGVVIIGHGKSTPRAFHQMIIRAIEMVKKDLNKKIENALNTQNIIDKDA